MSKFHHTYELVATEWPTRTDAIDAAGLVLFLIAAWGLTDFAGAMLS